MFISVLELFKIGIGPSSSHTMGPMTAAADFLNLVSKFLSRSKHKSGLRIQCILKGSLAFTGKGHASDKAVVLGLNGYSPKSLIEEDTSLLIKTLWNNKSIKLNGTEEIEFSPEADIIFDNNDPLPEHPNGMIFNLIDNSGKILLSQIYFSIGGGFINTQAEIQNLKAPIKMIPDSSRPYAFSSAESMLQMSVESGLSIAEMKRLNELVFISENELNNRLDEIWNAMRICLERGLSTDGILPGGLNINRRAHKIFNQLNLHTNITDWLSVYAMAVNEENSAGHMVVTAPTNGAAGVIPAVLYYFINHRNGTKEQIREFLLTASAIGGLIKHRSSISGAEVGCQGEVGSASSMAAAGLCALKGGTPHQVENAAEIALEHHLGMTCDPIGGLVQIPCIERNAFGAVKAYTAASLALRGDGQQFIPLDKCIAAMKETGLAMSHKYKETSLGGLAVSITEC
ncbi:MAG: L-serine ammonia-lyase [Ignavibacteriae bacterium]|nr:L-serine ammonia-lyase [Ignavibacteriota bacterium]NOH00111.1 L-serine ammonia-lyase [Ignavibacteriota bacterium]